MDFAQQAHLPVKHGVDSNTKEAKIGHFSDLTFHYNSQTREKGKKIIPTKKKIATRTRATLRRNTVTCQYKEICASFHESGRGLFLFSGCKGNTFII
jgi:hypothetical protein